MLTPAHRRRRSGLPPSHRSSAALLSFCIANVPQLSRRIHISNVGRNPTSPRNDWMTWLTHCCANPSMATLKPHSNGPLCRNTVIGTMVVDVWAVTFGTARRGLGGLHCAQSPACCTKCNSPPINGQCTNFTLQLHCNPAAINCWRFRLFCLIYSVRCSCNVPDMRVSP